MKWFVIIAAGMLTLLVAVYVVLFTGFGNGIVSPLIEAKIEEHLGRQVHVEKFELHMGRFALNLATDEANRIETDGKLYAFSPGHRCPVPGCAWTTWSASPPRPGAC